MDISSKVRRRWGSGVLVVAAVASASLAAALTTALVQRTPGAASTRTVIAAQPASLAKTSLTVGQIYARDGGGVVDVSVATTSVDPWGRPRSVEAEGSGFVVDKQGDIVTSAHVVSDATTITVAFKNGTTSHATLVGADPSTDVAVIRVAVPAAKLSPLAFASSSSVKVGDPVVAIGSPFGYPQSVTIGIVSAVGRTIEAPDGGMIRNVLQTDAAINSGNSGGPLIDASGKVIGVNAQIASRSGGSDGVGFAVPADTAKASLRSILAGGGV